MNNSLPKWLVRAGALILVLGFFLPSVAVSCSVLGVTQSQSYSLNDLAGAANRPLLYFVLIGALATLIIAFIPARTKSQWLIFLIGEIIGYGAGILSILVALLSLIGQIQQMGLTVNLNAGILVLLLGYGVGGVGMVLEFFQRDKIVTPTAWEGWSAPTPDMFASPPAPPPIAGARLELMSGNAPSTVSIQGTDFMIGRGGQSQLRLPDPRVSSAHARLRYAQGAWFIQDQNSSNGTFVNGMQIQAQRLNDGDQIQVGDTTYIIRM